MGAAMGTREFCREMTEESLSCALRSIKKNYMVVYDDYYSPNGKRDSAFLKDLVDSIQGIDAILEVYVRGKSIDPDYALSKLKFSKSYIDSAICYYESKVRK